MLINYQGVMEVVDTHQFIEQRVFRHAAATWPRHKSGISRVFMIQLHFLLTSIRQDILRIDRTSTDFMKHNFKLSLETDLFN